MSVPFQLITEYKTFGADEVIATQRQLIEEFKQGELSTSEFSKAIRANSEQTRVLNSAYKDMYRTARVSNWEFYKGMDIMRDIGRIGNTLTSMWQAYTIQQIRIEAATRDVAATEAEVAKWEDLAAQYLRDFGEGSALYLDAKDKAEEYRKKLEEIKAEQAKVTQEGQFGWFGMGLQASYAASQIGMIWLHIKEMGGIGSILSGIGSGLTSVYADIGTKLGLALGSEAVTAISSTLLTAVFPPLIGGWLAGIPPEQMIFGKEGFAGWSTWVRDNLSRFNWSDLIPFRDIWTSWYNSLVDAWNDANRAWTEWLGGNPNPTGASGAGGVGYEERPTITPTPTPSEATVLTGPIGLYGFGQPPPEYYMPRGQFGIPYVPETGAYILERGERVLTPEQAQMERPVIVRELNITQHNYISKEMDADEAADLAYRKLMKKFAK